MKSEKKYLASANTTSGFVNKFNFINNEENSFTYILKGGPGTGKSTLMKHVGLYFKQKNMDVEYFYCSSDSDSLDAVRIKNFSIVDGTAPHVVEAIMPQVKEKIVNIGQFIGTDVSKYKIEIEKHLKIKTLKFKKAYLLFESLGKIFEAESIDAKHDKNINKFDEIVESLNYKSGKGKTRELFSSFIYKQGFKTFYKQNNYAKQIVLTGNFIENEILFNGLAKLLEDKKVDFIKFYSIFMPNFIEGIFLEKTNTLIVCENSFLENFATFHNRIIIEKLIKQIAKNLDEAKQHHKKVEKYYIKNMNFDGLNEEEKRIINEIESKIK